jgi:hypothetical protein
MTRSGHRWISRRASGEPDAGMRGPNPDEASFRAWHDTSSRVFLFPWPTPRPGHARKDTTRRD